MRPLPADGSLISKGEAHVRVPAGGKGTEQAARPHCFCSHLIGQNIVTCSRPATEKLGAAAVAKERWLPQATSSPESAMGQILPDGPQKGPTLPAPWSRTTSLQNCETILFWATLFVVYGDPDNLTQKEKQLKKTSHSNDDHMWQKCTRTSVLKEVLCAASPCVYLVLLMPKKQLSIIPLPAMQICTYVLRFAVSLAPRLSINAGGKCFRNVPLMCAQFPSGYSGWHMLMHYCCLTINTCAKRASLSFQREKNQLFHHIRTYPVKCFFCYVSAVIWKSILFNKAFSLGLNLVKL